MSGDSQANNLLRENVETRLSGSQDDQRDKWEVGARAEIASRVERF